MRMKAYMYASMEFVLLGRVACMDEGLQHDACSVLYAVAASHGILGHPQQLHQHSCSSKPQHLLH